MRTKPTGLEPATPAMMESEAQRAAATQAETERRAEKNSTRANAIQAIGVVTVIGLLVGGAALYLLRAAPRDSEPGSMAQVPGQKTSIGELAFLATADDGHSAVWRYQSPIRAEASVILGKAGSRHVEVLGPATNTDLSRYSGAAPTELPFTQTGDDIQIVVDGVTRTLRFHTFNEPCASDPTRKTRQWNLCEKAVDGGAFTCVEAPELVEYCLTAEPRLVSLHRSGDVLWVIAERPMPATPRMAAGAVMPTLFAHP
jgi:hypothetical protein